MTPSFLFLFLVLQAHLSREQRLNPEMRKRLNINRRLRTLDEQFRKFQERTLAQLQIISETYNTSYSADARFRELILHLDAIVAELKSVRVEMNHNLASSKSCTRTLQRKVGRLEQKLVGVERASRGHARRFQEHGTALANLTLEVTGQRNRFGSLENRLGTRNSKLQDSLKEHHRWLSKLEDEVREFQYRRVHLGGTEILGTPPSFTKPNVPDLGISPGTELEIRSIIPKDDDRMKNRILPSPPGIPESQNPPSSEGSQISIQDVTLQTTRKEKEKVQGLLQLPLRHKIPQNYTPKKTAKICNVNSMLLFPSPSTRNYVTFLTPFLTSMHELSICTWLKVTDYVGTLLSYATLDNDNALVLYGRRSGLNYGLDFVVGDPSYRQLSVDPILDGSWHHMCVIWSSIEGRFWYYVDGQLASTGTKFQKGYEIPPGGWAVLGQEQDRMGGGFDEAEAFVGRLAGFALWSRALNLAEVTGLATGKGVPRGALLTLDDVDTLHGSVQQVTCECLEYCP